MAERRIVITEETLLEQGIDPKKLKALPANVVSRHIADPNSTMTVVVGPQGERVVGIATIQHDISVPDS